MSKWVAVGGDRVYRPWKKWAEGDVMTGTYQDSYRDNFGNTGWIIKVDSTDFENENDNIPEGTIFGANHSGGFSSKMEKLDKGAFIQIEYVEMTTLEKGAYKGKQCHQVNVAIDPTKSPSPTKDDVDIVEVEADL